MPRPARMLPHTDPAEPLLWVRRGDGLAAREPVLRLEAQGPERVARLAALWREVVASAIVDDTVGTAGSTLSGTGLVAFGAIAFAGDSAETSALIVPGTVVGRRGDAGWITTITVLDETSPGPIAASATRPEAAEDAAALVEAELAREAEPFGDEYRIALLPGRISKQDYLDNVAAAVRRIDAGEARKTVLARDLVGQLPPEADLRLALRHLGLGYPDCWTFAVDGLVGASPETLVRVQAGRASARVLAGSAARGADADADRASAEALLASAKDREEHDYAIASAVAALEGRVAGLTASAEPFALKLPNLWHLASDLEGAVAPGEGALELVGALHPTAAVAGTPRDAALALLSELEAADRGRYAGPVGWIDAAGDGEWAVALRCAQVEGGRVTAWAGCGIVAGSQPERELDETRLKFRPVVEAFG